MNKKNFAALAFSASAFTMLAGCNNDVEKTLESAPQPERHVTVPEDTFAYYKDIATSCKNNICNVSTAFAACIVSPDNHAIVIDKASDNGIFATSTGGSLIPSKETGSCLYVDPKGRGALKFEIK